MACFGEFAERLKEIRLKQGKTQKEVAEAAGVTAATVSSYESGAKSPTLDTAAGCAEFLGVSLDWLCGLEKKGKDYSSETFEDVARLLAPLAGGSTWLEIKADELRLDMTAHRYISFAENSSDEVVYLDKEPDVDDFGCMDICANPLYDFLAEYRHMDFMRRNGSLKQHIFDLWLDDAYKTLGERKFRG